MRKYYDYKPIPKYKKGDKVFRVWSGLFFHHAEAISRVIVKEHEGKYWIEYYFPRERTPYDESELVDTLKEQLEKEVRHVIDTAKSQIEGICETAKKEHILIEPPQRLLEE